MHVADALLLLLLALADVALMVYLRRARARRLRQERMNRSLQLAIRRELGTQRLTPRRYWRMLRAG